MTGIRAALKKHLETYEYDLCKKAVEEAYLKGTPRDTLSPEDFFGSSKINLMIEDDLLKNGFTNPERNQILDYQIDDNTMYKFLAYEISRENDNNIKNIDDLKTILQDDITPLEDISEDDIQKIFEEAKAFNDIEKETIEYGE